MKSEEKCKIKAGCTELTRAAEEIDLSNTRTNPNGTAEGKYKFRYCGLLFETTEVHDQHHQKEHVQTQNYLQAMNEFKNSNLDSAKFP